MIGRRKSDDAAVNEKTARCAASVADGLPSTEENSGRRFFCKKNM